MFHNVDTARVRCYFLTVLLYPFPCLSIHDRIDNCIQGRMTMKQL